MQITSKKGGGRESPVPGKKNHEKLEKEGRVRTICPRTTHYDVKAFIVVDDVAKNKYELSDDKIVYETENYTVYDIDGKQLIKTKTNLGFEVLEGFDTVEKGLDFIVIEQANLGDIRDTAII